MPDISWIKIKTNMFDDEKIKLIEAMPEADTVLIIWLKLLVQAGKCNNNGLVTLTLRLPYSVEMLSTIFNRPLQTVKYSIKVLQDLSLIEMSDSNVICISNWEKHQNIDGMDKIKLQNRERQAKYREKQKLLLAPNQTNSNVTVTQHNGIDLEENKSKKKNLKTFVEDSSEFQLSKLLLDLILKRNPENKIPDLQKWAKNIDLMIRVDKRTPEAIEGAIRWCQNDEFWQNNILSTSKLRKQYDTLYLKAKNGNKKQPQSVVTEDDWKDIAESIANDDRLK